MEASWAANLKEPMQMFSVQVSSLPPPVVFPSGFPGLYLLLSLQIICHILPEHHARLQKAWCFCAQEGSIKVSEKSNRKDLNY